MEREAGNSVLLGKAVRLSHQKPRLNKAQRSRGAVGNIATPGKISAAACTRIIAVSPFARATKKEIVDFVAMHSKALIVLPGNRNNTPSPQNIQRAIRGGSVVFAEGEKGKNGKTRIHRYKEKNQLDAAANLLREAHGGRCRGTRDDLALQNDSGGQAEGDILYLRGADRIQPGRQCQAPSQTRP